MNRNSNTKEQHDISNWLEWGTSGPFLLIEAKAGSGRTTIICQGYLQLSKLRLRGRSLFLAFNRGVVNEVKNKVLISSGRVRSS